MSKLLKSKILLGVLVVAVMAVVGFTSNVKSASADCSITSTLRVGSTGTQVVCLQTALGGLTADGVFGPMTKAAVVAWQAKEGLVADGIFGPKSNAVWMANAGNSANFPAGCASTVGFSSTTGLSCGIPVSTGFTPAGCTSAAGYSPVTGGACQLASGLPAGCTSAVGFSPTTGASCATGAVVSTNTGPLAGGAGTIDITPTTTDVEDVAIEGQATKVLGFKVEASDSDLAITNLKLSLENTVADALSPYRLTNYVDSVDIYMGSTKVGSALASDFSKTGNEYTKSIALSNAVVRMGATKKATFYVVLNAVSNIDSANMTGKADVATFTAIVTDLRYQDATGVIMTEGTVATHAGITFDTLASAGDVKLTITKGSGSPVEGTVTISDTGSTSDIKMLEFKLKATGSDLSFDQITFATTAVSTKANLVSDMVQGLELRHGTDVLASDPIFLDAAVVSNATGSVDSVKFILDDTYTISQDSTDTFVVYAKIADVTDFTAGSLKVGLAVGGIVTEDSNGDIAANSGAATGTTQTFSASAALVGNYSWTVNATGTALDFLFTVDNSAGDAAFVVTTADVNDALAIGNTGTVRTDGAGYVTDIKGVVTWYSGDVVTAHASDYYTVAAGDTATFRVRYSLGATVNTAITATQNGQTVEVLVNSVAGQTVTSTKVHSPSATVNL